MKPIPQYIEDPEKVDSDDLSADEAMGARESRSVEDWVQQVAAQGTPEGHEMRRRGPDLFIRTRFEDGKIAVFKTNWLGKT